MDFFHNPKPKHPLIHHHNKKRLTQDQVKLLERSFSCNSKLEPERKLLLAKQLGVPPRQVAIWYQNKRARWKTQTMELGYTAIQAKLETALAEKRRLEKDVERLRGELKRAHEVVLALSRTEVVGPAQHHHHHHHPVICSMFSACDEEGAASSSQLQHEDVNNHNNHHDHEVKQLEDLYACLIGM